MNQTIDISAKDLALRSEMEKAKRAMEEQRIGINQMIKHIVFNKSLNK